MLKTCGDGLGWFLHDLVLRHYKGHVQLRVRLRESGSCYRGHLRLPGYQTRVFDFKVRNIPLGSRLDQALWFYYRDDTFIALEVHVIERDQSIDAVNDHRGHDPRTMSVLALYRMLIHKCFTFSVDLWSIRPQGKDGFKFGDVRHCVTHTQFQPILSLWSRCNYPNLIHTLCK